MPALQRDRPRGVGGVSLGAGVAATTIECFFDGGGLDAAYGAGLTMTTLRAFLSESVERPSDLSSALKLFFSGAAAAGSLVPYLPQGQPGTGGAR